MGAREINFFVLKKYLILNKTVKVLGIYFSFHNNSVFSYYYKASVLNFIHNRKKSNYGSDDTVWNIRRFTRLALFFTKLYNVKPLK